MLVADAVSSTQSAGGGGAGGTATGSNNKDGGIGKANPIVGSTQWRTHQVVVII